jgi:fatty acid desaturase
MIRQETWVTEWPTLAILAVAYLAWGLGTTVLAAWSVPQAIVVTALAIAQHSSVTHEVIHGHPFSNPRLNAALVFPALGLVFPYHRFRDTHLAHHMDCELTDPYDDPESNFLDERDWRRLPRWLRMLLNLNNTLAGRLVLGPAIGLVYFLICETRKARTDPAVLRGWLLHLPALALVLIWLSLAQMPWWAYAVACYASHSLIRIRTFLEHRAHDRAPARSVIIEDNGPLSILFLNNNLHAVHHMHPRVPWYRLRQQYAQNRARYLSQNQGYIYRSYLDVFRQHFLHQKDPVPHPLWRR